MLKDTRFLAFWRSLNASRVARGLAPVKVSEAARAYFAASL